eukprot:scaffold31155_cov79-Isochrysis_galbana.AAC.1
MDVETGASDEDEELRRALAFSLLPEVAGGGGVGEGPQPDTAEGRAAALLSLVFGSASPSVHSQWLQQGIAFAAPPAPPLAGALPGTVPFTAGLAQSQGGPCAVLAAVQAFTLRRLLFDPRCEKHGCEERDSGGEDGGGPDGNRPGEAVPLQAHYGPRGSGGGGGGAPPGGMVADGRAPYREVAVGGWAASAGVGALCRAPAAAEAALVAGIADLLWQAATEPPATTDTGGGGTPPPTPSRRAVVALPEPVPDTAGGGAAAPPTQTPDVSDPAGPSVLFSASPD